MIAAPPGIANPKFDTYKSSDEFELVNINDVCVSLCVNALAAFVDVSGDQLAIVAVLGLVHPVFEYVPRPYVSSNGAPTISVLLLVILRPGRV